MAGVSRMAASMLAGDMPIRPGARDTLRLARGETLLRVAWVPREMFADAHELQCWDNHAFPLNAVRVLSGFSAGEVVLVLSCMPRGWMPPEDEAHRVLRGLIAAFGRGRHIPRED